MQRKSIGTLLLALATLVLFTQGFTLHELIPVSVVSIIVGVNSASFVTFFIYPFLFLILRLFWIGGRSFLAAGSQDASQFVQAGRSFWVFMTDFFRWVIALWFALMSAFAMVFLGLIPNQDPPLFFVILNFYLAFFVYFLVLRRMMGGDYFDGVQNIFHSRAVIPGDQSAQLGISIVRKFFSFILTMVFTAVFLVAFFVFVSLIS